eukprot:TRINITY_DN104738_c0_g1_i1.p1 TRINITY_DN104738_c0_g1~~TRINITY_DN104738_c0_g1_i1.p1  ORF type:complete len:353 (-),score=83.97 TRINITY_DN104738_c0_g1_i1:155-1213(-)
MLTKASLEPVCKSCGNQCMADSSYCRRCGQKRASSATRSLATTPDLPRSNIPLGERLRALQTKLEPVLTAEAMPSSSSCASPPNARVGSSPADHEHVQAIFDSGAMDNDRSRFLEASHVHANPREAERQLMQLEQRVTQVCEGEVARTKVLADQSQRLQEGLHAMRVAREIHEERRQKEVKVVESGFLMDCERTTGARIAMTAHLEEAGHAAIEECRAEVQKECQAREAVHHNYAREIAEEVQRLMVHLEEQRTARMEYGERIIGSLEAEFQKVHDAILSEQKLRFDAEATMLRMVEDVCSRLRGEIHKEKMQREAVQGKLLGLLEEACGRIEASFSSEPRYPEVGRRLFIK